MNNISDIVSESIETTINKNYQGLDELSFKDKYYNHTKIALEKIFKEGNFKYFTRQNNARDNMMGIGRDAIMVELIKGAYEIYSIETIKGYARNLSMGPNGYPTTEAQAVNYIFNQLSTQSSPSVVYVNLQRDPNLTDLLISNYASLVSNYTKEERIQGYNAYAPYMQDKLNTLDNLQKNVLSNPQQLQNNTNIYH